MIPRKLLITTDHYYPVHGGIEQYLRYFSRYLTSQGIDVTVLSGPGPSHSDFPTSENIFEGVRVIYEPLLTGSVSDPFSVQKKYREVSECIKKINPDLVFANNHNSLAVIRAAKLVAKPVVYGCHGVGLMCSFKRRFMKPDDSLCWDGPGLQNCWACYRTKDPFPVRALGYLARGVPKVQRYQRARDLLESADGILCNSTATKRLFAGAGIPGRARLDGFPLMIDTRDPTSGFFTDIDKALLDKLELTHKNYLLVPGRLQTIKGQIYALEGYLKSQSNLPLVFVGNAGLDFGEPQDLGIYGQSLLERARSLGPEFKSKIKFLGKLGIQDLRKVYSSARLTIVPSIWIETFGYVTLESMACGTPVIVTENCGSAECVQNDGRVVPRKDSDSISKAILDLDLGHLEMGQRAQARVQSEFTLETLGKRTLSFLDQCSTC